MRTREETARRMREYRQENNIPLRKMSSKADVSGSILTHLENGEWITHPRIVARVCAAYRLDVDDYNNMVHENHRATTLPKPRKSARILTRADFDTRFDK